MNRFYRLVWNHALGMLQVASVLAKTASDGAHRQYLAGGAPLETPHHGTCAAALRLLDLKALALSAWASAIAVKTPQSLLVTMNA